MKTYKINTKQVIHREYTVNTGQDLTSIKSFKHEYTRPNIEDYMMEEVINVEEVKKEK